MTYIIIIIIIIIIEYNLKKVYSAVANIILIMSQSIPTGYIPRGLARKHCPGHRDLNFESCLGAENSTRGRIL